MGSKKNENYSFKRSEYYGKGFLLESEKARKELAPGSERGFLAPNPESSTCSLWKASIYCPQWKGNKKILSLLVSKGGNSFL